MIAIGVRGVLFDVIFALGVVCWALTLGTGLAGLSRYLGWRRRLQEQEGTPYRIVVTPAEVRTEVALTRRLFQSLSPTDDDESRIAARRDFIRALRFALLFVGLACLALIDRSI